MAKMTKEERKEKARERLREHDERVAEFPAALVWRHGPHYKRTFGLTVAGGCSYLQIEFTKSPEAKFDRVPEQFGDGILESYIFQLSLEEAAALIRALAVRYNDAVKRLNETASEAGVPLMAIKIPAQPPDEQVA